MHISLEKKKLGEAVYIVSKFAERKSATLPVLSAVLLIAGDEGIKMRATNLETGIDLKIQGECISKGVAAIPAVILQQIAGSFTQEGQITIEHTGDVLSITSGTSKSLLKTVPYEDFPSIPFPENSQKTLEISGNVLKSLFTTLAPCASTSMVRPELASVYVTIEGGILTAVTTDSFRLAEKKIPLNNKGIQGKFLIPAKNAIDIAQALPDSTVTLSFDEHQCAFISDGEILISRLTNATYPDYRQIIPKEVTAEAVFLRKDFENALKRTVIFSDSFQKIRISFDPKKNQCALFSKNADIGESIETINSQISGDPIELSFNHRYLSTIFTLTHAESVVLQAVGIGRPLIIKGVGDNSLLYLVSPMNQ